MTPPLNFLAPSRRQSLYIGSTPWQRPVFLVNSRLGRFSAAFRGFSCKRVYLGRHPLSRSYGVNLPSSLTGVLSSALGFSPCQPVSVLVRFPNRLARGHFLEGFRVTDGLTPRTRLLDLNASDLPEAIHRASTSLSYRGSLTVRPSIPQSLKRRQGVQEY